MKLKKLLALACSLVMSASLFASTALVADAAVEGATATLEFAGYEVKGAATFAKINVKATIPETLVPYEVIAADWVDTFEDSYKGLMIQGVGFDIPNVAGLTYVGSLSTKADFVTLTDNKTDSKLQISYAATGSYDTYYAGSVDTLATLYYRITGDLNATYNVALSDAVIGLVSIDEVTGSATPYEYTFKDFTVTGATVEPEKEDEPKYPSDEAYVTEELTVADVTNPYVRISLGEKTNDYYLPAGVKGDAKVYGLLKYTADGTNIKHGDVFKLELRSKNSAEGTLVKALADHTVNTAD